MIPAALFAQEDEAAAEEVVEPVPEELLLETTLPKIQGKEEDTFTFSFNTTYGTGDEPFGLEEDETDKTFDITVEYPTGWYAGVVSGSQEIPAIILKSGSRQSLQLFAVTLVDQEPGEYPFKVTFKSGIEGDPLEESIDFTAVITATYEIVLTTKTGELSTDLTAGKDNHYKLIVTNNSSISVENITLTSTEPEGWQVSFDKEKIESMLHIVEGKKENVKTIMDTVEKFFENLHLEIEDWKISVEESREGTRVFVRFQIIVKK